MSKTPVFISGIGRSGTSAVIKSIAEHHEVVKPDRVGEAPFIGHFVKFLHDYEDVSSAREYNLKNYQLCEKQRAEEFSRLLAMLQYGTDISQDHVGGNHWVAKVSLPEHHFRKAQAVLGDVKIIYVMRNGIEVVNSAKSFHGFADLSFEQLCTRWVENIEQCRYVHTDPNCAVVRHDKLVSDPHAVYEAIFEKLGMASDSGPADFISTNLFNSSFDKTSELESTVSVFNERLKCWDDWTDEEQQIFKTICDEKMVEYKFERPYCDSPNKLSDLVVNDDAQVMNVSTVSNIDSIGELNKEQEVALSEVKNSIANSMRDSQFNYYANPSDKYDYLFIENPKVASTTLLRKLQSAELDPGGTLPEDIHNRDSSPISRFLKLSDREQWDMFFSENIFRFTFVRNPYSRLLSAYLSKIDKSLRAKAEILAVIQGKDASEVTDLSPTVSFEEFVDVVCGQNTLEMNAHWKPQVDQVLFGSINYDFIGCFENLLSDYNCVSEKLFGVREPELGQSKNWTGSSSKISTYYNSILQKKVLDCFETDFEKFGYSEDINDVLSVRSE